MPKYVCKGAKLKCSMGSKESSLGVVRPECLEGKGMATIMDHKPMVNVRPFGKCKSLLNPIVAAATAAAKKLQKMPCIPNTPAPWLKASGKVSVKGQSALTDGSKLCCCWAGVIKVAKSGQKTILTG